MRCMFSSAVTTIHVAPHALGNPQELRARLEEADRAGHNAHEEALKESGAVEALQEELARERAQGDEVRSLVICATIDGAF